MKKDSKARGRTINNIYTHKNTMNQTIKLQTKN